MADPIQTIDGRPVRYAVRDAIGVEGFERSESGQRMGINAELQFVRSIHAVQTREHNAVGIHDTPPIARAVLLLRWTGVEYRLLARSYLLGAYGSNVASITRLGAGRLEVKLLTSIGTVRYALADASLVDASIGSSLDQQIVRTEMQAIVTTEVFRVNRYAGDAPSTLALADGDCAFRIYSE